MEKGKRHKEEDHMGTEEDSMEKEEEVRIEREEEDRMVMALEDHMERSKRHMEIVALDRVGNSLLWLLQHQLHLQHNPLAGM